MGVATCASPTTTTAIVQPLCATSASLVGPTAEPLVASSTTTPAIAQQVGTSSVALAGPTCVLSTTASTPSSTPQMVRQFTTKQ